MPRHEHTMPFGTTRDARGSTTFRLWAPGAQRVELLLGPARAPEAHPMQPQEGPGWFQAQRPDVAPGTHYAFRIDGALVVPDPASRHNPEDVHGPSAVVDPQAFAWPDDGWRGRPWREAVVYELHVGTFTPQGTFTAAIERLDDLAALGVTAIELMPVADFPGVRGWGYDGVLQYAPEASYGTPEDLKRLVVAAHARGLMVLLDVVYNHFGPDGNYLYAYAQPFFNQAIHTPWGAAIHFDGPQARTVRDFFIHNALYWIEEYQLDGLRLDAVHAMHDGSHTHFIDELALAVRTGPGRTRPVHLVLENDTNDAARLPRDTGGAALLADAQWNDDVHHAIHVLATGDTQAYYADYAAQPRQLLARALAEGFAFQGEPSAFRGGEPRGTPCAHLPPAAFVNSLQTHDQVGNRALGDRIAQLAAAQGRTPVLQALTACVLLSPAVPMLFMGEEYAASTPYLYFCDFQGELARAVTEGRRNEFKGFAQFADPLLRETIPDPNAASTQAASQLDWSERGRPPHAGWLALYTALLAVRRAHLTPWLAGAGSGRFTLTDGGTLHVQWPLAQGRHWHLRAQLADVDLAPDAPACQPVPQSQRVHASHGDRSGMPAWSVEAWLAGGGA
jgi:maltooligosyltrehalose trehalohydrolase